MEQSKAGGVVHLELHTRDLARAWAFYAGLFEWRLESVRQGSRSYLATDLGGGVGGGIVECGAFPPRWLPYVNVRDIEATTARAVRLGAQVLLNPREGPAGWRSVLVEPSGGEIALWQPKR
jgi:predicted enzyme related to lactoylglutathione lyase